MTRMLRHANVAGTRSVSMSTRTFSRLQHPTRLPLHLGVRSFNFFGKTESHEHQICVACTRLEHFDDSVMYPVGECAVRLFRRDLPVDQNFFAPLSPCHTITPAAVSWMLSELNSPVLDDIGSVHYLSSECSHQNYEMNFEVLIERDSMYPFGPILPLKSLAKCRLLFQVALACDSKRIASLWVTVY